MLVDFREGVAADSKARRIASGTGTPGGRASPRPGRGELKCRADIGLVLTREDANGEHSRAELVRVIEGLGRRWA